MSELYEIRERIDEIDKQLTALFIERMDCAKQVGEYKKEHKLPILNSQREIEILDSMQELGGEYGTFVRLLYSNIMQLSRELQHTIVQSGSGLRRLMENAPKKPSDAHYTIACQGIRGANSHEAARRLFKNDDIKFCKTFSEVFNAIENDEADFAVLPVENSSAGSVSDVYDLILKHRFFIVDALDLKINHCLCGLKQSTLEDIEYVWSHSQAIAQCSEYIGGRNFQAVTYLNTAVAAKAVFDEKRLNCAAVCSEYAAQEYNLQVLAKNIQNNPNNTTRFIVISKQLFVPEDASKISLCFSVPHTTGSLYSVLCRFNALGLNITKIESRPMQGMSFEYLFYLDFAGSVNNDAVRNLLCSLSEELPEFSFLGSYAEHKA